MRTNSTSFYTLLGRSQTRAQELFIAEEKS